MHPKSVMGVAGLTTSEVTGDFQMRIWFGERIVNGTCLTWGNDRNKDNGRAIHTSHRHIIAHRRHNHKFVRDGSFIRNDEMIYYSDMKRGNRRGYFILHERYLHCLLLHSRASTGRTRIIGTLRAFDVGNVGTTTATGCDSCDAKEYEQAKKQRTFHPKTLFQQIEMYKRDITKLLYGKIRLCRQGDRLTQNSESRLYRHLHLLFLPCRATMTM
jgi:hypothetical protein